MALELSTVGDVVARRKRSWLRTARSTSAAKPPKSRARTLACTRAKRCPPSWLMTSGPSTVRMRVTCETVTVPPVGVRTRIWATASGVDGNDASSRTNDRVSAAAEDHLRRGHPARPSTASWTSATFGPSRCRDRHRFRYGPGLEVAVVRGCELQLPIAAHSETDSETGTDPPKELPRKPQGPGKERLGVEGTKQPDAQRTA